MKKDKTSEALSGSLIIGSSSGLFPTSTNTAGISQWGYPEFIEAKEVGDTIEFIFKEEGFIQSYSCFNSYPSCRVSKIVYSCKKGKWNKSEPIYGKIVPASQEAYDFD